jgi:hypothetical protein
LLQRTAFAAGSTGYRCACPRNCRRTRIKRLTQTSHDFHSFLLLNLRATLPSKDGYISDNLEIFVETLIFFNSTPIKHGNLRIQQETQEILRQITCVLPLIKLFASFPVSLKFGVLVKRAGRSDRDIFPARADPCWSGAPGRRRAACVGLTPCCRSWVRLGYLVGVYTDRVSYPAGRAQTANNLRSRSEDNLAAKGIS